MRPEKRTRCCFCGLLDRDRKVLCHTCRGSAHEFHAERLMVPRMPRRYTCYGCLGQESEPVESHRARELPPRIREVGAANRRRGGL